MVVHRSAKRTSSESISTIQVLVDSRVSALAAVGVPATSDTIIARTPLYADYAASPRVREMIAARARVNPLSLSVVANTSETQGLSGGVESSSYNTAPAPNPRNEVTVDGTDLLPLLTISARSPNPDGASALVNATVVSLQEAIASIAHSERVPLRNQMVLRPLGQPENAYRVGSKSKTSSIIAGVAVFVVLLFVGLTLDWTIRIRRRRRGVLSPIDELASADDAAGSEAGSEPANPDASPAESVAPPIPLPTVRLPAIGFEDPRWAEGQEGDDRPGEPVPEDDAPDA